MLVKFKKSRLIGTRVYAVGEAAELPDEVVGPLIKNKTVSVVTDAVKPEKSEKPEKSDEAKPAKK